MLDELSFPYNLTLAGTTKAEFIQIRRFPTPMFASLSVFYGF
jgi:hypothetical protein